MNTVKKGSAFEEKTFNALKKLLETGKLGLMAQNSKIFRQKGYYSRDRDAKIALDISIEVYLDDAPNWSTLWAIECKDHKKAVPVGKIEEFAGKVTQIGGLNVKALFVTTGALQEGAFSFAKSKGIGYIRILPDNQVKWELYATNSAESEGLSPNEVVKAVTDPAYSGTSRDFFGIVGQHVYGDWPSLFKEKASDNQRVRPDTVFSLYVKRSGKNKKELKNRKLYRHIQQAYEYVKEKGLTDGLLPDAKTTIYHPQLNSVFEIPYEVQESDDESHNKTIAWIEQAKQTRTRHIITAATDDIEADTRSVATSKKQEAEYVTAFQHDSSSGQLSVLGLEAYAVYLPIHFYFSDYERTVDWGIYISEEGIRKLAAIIKEACTAQFGEPDADLTHLFTKIAYQILYRHELQHFKIESFALNAELLTGNSIYVPYINGVYGPTYRSDDCLEEAIANAAVLNSTVIKKLFDTVYPPPKSNPKRILPWQSLVKEQFFDSQPGGYRNYDLYFGWPSELDQYSDELTRWQRALNYLCNQIITGELRPETKQIPFYASPPTITFYGPRN